MHTQGLAVAFLSVSRSVRLSVKRVDCDEIIYCQNSHTVYTIHSLVFRQEEWLMGKTPCT